MHYTPKAAALILMSALLAACSSGGSFTPLTTAPAHSPSSSGAKPAQFLTAATPATNTDDFTYDASPPNTALSQQDSSNTPNAFFPAPSACIAAFGLECLSPAQMRRAYNVPSTLDGTGQTIVIVEAYGSATIQSDLHIFDIVNGLPDTTLNIVYPAGPPTATNGGWAGETSLDVEWAHAIAPRATIDLVVAKTNRNSDLMPAEQYAIQNHLGNIISMSFGASEPSIPGGVNNANLQRAHDTFQNAKEAGITMIASSGDAGASNGRSTLTPQFPAVDPLVLSVGGTDLFTDDAGNYQSETVWNDTNPAQCPFGCLDGIFGATGGAPSSFFATPSYQQMLTHSPSRETADVGYDAGIYTGVWVIDSFGVPPGFFGFGIFGGTSAGAPQWAGIIALANQAAGHPLGFVNQALYVVGKSGQYNSAFHDVTTGNNALFSLPGESAGPGYDMPTGLGTPNVANLIPALIAAWSN